MYKDLRWLVVAVVALVGCAASPTTATPSSTSPTTLSARQVDDQFWIEVTEEEAARRAEAGTGTGVALDPNDVYNNGLTREEVAAEAAKDFCRELDATQGDLRGLGRGRVKPTQRLNILYSHFGGIGGERAVGVIAVRTYCPRWKEQMEAFR